MKQYLLPVFLLFTTVAYSQSMTDAQMKEAAAAMCNCIEPAVKKLHPQLMIMMKTIDAKGEKEAEAELMKWMGAATAEEQKAIGESLAYMQTGFIDSINVCQKKTDKYFPKNSIENLGEKDTNRLMKIMEEMPVCNSLLLFMKIGKKEEEEEGQQ